MITIIHGEDVASSRDYFFSEKQKSLNPVIINGENLNITSLHQILEAKSLFFETKDIFIDNFFSAKTLPDEFKQILSLLKRTHLKFNIFFWEGNELSKSDLNQFKDARIKPFKLAQNLFSFLDNIKPKNPQNLILFHKALDTSDESLIFYMLIRQFRLLLALSDSSPSIDEVKKLFPWQREKLERQASLFNLSELKTIYNRLFEIDYKSKSGRLANTISQAIDILLLDI